MEDMCRFGKSVELKEHRRQFADSVGSIIDKRDRLGIFRCGDWIGKKKRLLQGLYDRRERLLKLSGQTKNDARPMHN